MTHYYFDATYHKDYASTIGPNDVPDTLVFTIDDEAVANAKNLLSSLPPSALIQLPVEVFETTTDDHGVQRIDRHHGNYYDGYVTINSSDNLTLELEYEAGDMLSPELAQMEIQLTPVMIVDDEFMNNLNGAPYNSSMEL